MNVGPRKLKACDQCRARKNKCEKANPFVPCGFCFKSKIECTTTVRKRAKQANTNVSKKALLIQLSEKMSKLESLIEENVFGNVAMPKTAGLDVCFDENVYNSISFCNQLGFKWMVSGITEDREDRFMKILDIHSAIYEAYCVEINLFIKPIEILRPLPPVSMIEEMIAWYTAGPDNHLINVFTLDEAEELVKRYKDEPYTFNSSDYLLLNLLICWASVHMKMTSTDKPSIDYFEELEKAHFQNSIYYYKKMLLGNGGYDAVQGMILLSIYTLRHTVTQIHYTIATHAMRMGLGFGMHTQEFYSSMSERKAFNCKRVWLYCCCFDKIVSVTLGKPPVLRVADMHVYTDAEFQAVCNELLKRRIGSTVPDFNWGPDILHQDEFTRLLSMSCSFSEGFRAVLGHYLMKVCTFGQEMYETLFTTKAVHEIHTNFERCHNEVMRLNKKLDDWYDSLPVMLRQDNAYQMVDYLIALSTSSLSNQDIVKNLYAAVALHLQYHVYNCILNLLVFKLAVHRDPDIEPQMLKNDPLFGRCVQSSVKFLEIMIVVVSRTNNSAEPYAFGCQLSSLVMLLLSTVDPEQAQTFIPLYKDFLVSSFDNSYTNKNLRSHLLAYVLMRGFTSLIRQCNAVLGTSLYLEDLQEISDREKMQEDIIYTESAKIVRQDTSAEGKFKPEIINSFYTSIAQAAQKAGFF